MQASANLVSTARLRRSYVECQYGQLHLSSALPHTGGFNEALPLICLHDHGGSSHMFAQFLPLMAVDRSVYAVDLPGYGASDRPSAGAGFVDSVATLVRLFDDLCLDRIDLLGVGHGAALAIEIARQRPSLVRRALCLGLAPAVAVAEPFAQNATAATNRRTIDTSMALSGIVSELRGISRAQIEFPTKALLKTIQQLLD